MLALLLTLPWQRVARAADAPVPRAEPPLVSDLCQLRVEHGSLVLHSRLAVTGPVSQPEMQLRDLAGQSNVRIDKAAPGSDTPQVFYLINTNTRVPGANMVQTQITLNTGQLVIHQHFQADNGWRIVSIVQGANPGRRAAILPPAITRQPITFMVMRSEDGRNNTLRAADWTTLRHDYPDEVNQYLRPLFKWLRQDSLFGVEPVVAWQVFTQDWQPPPEVTRRVDRLLGAFDAEHYPDRSVAADHLRDEGFPAALYLSRRGMVGLSLEQRQRVESFLSRFPIITADTGAALAHDPDFLLDCLYSEDAHVREVALKRLVDIIHRPLEIPQSDDERRISVIESLRSELMTRLNKPPTFDEGLPGN